MRPAILTMSIVFAFLTGCGGQGASTTGPQATEGPGGQPNATPTAPPVVPGGGSTSIAHVEVQGGPLAGTYDATGAKFDCNTAAGGSGATFLDMSAAEGKLSGLTFTSGEGGSNPAKFYFQALFGPVAMSQPVLEIMTLDPSNPRGSGTAQLEDKGATIKWTIDGTTADGVKVKATIECGPVDRR